METASSSQEPGTNQTDVNKPASIDTSAAQRKAEEARAEGRHDPESVASSPVSTHSRESIDTTGMSEDEPLLQQGTPVNVDQHVSIDSRDPPPAYSAAAPRQQGAFGPARVPLQPNQQPNYGATGSTQAGYYTFPHPAPVTPAERPQEEGELRLAERKFWRRREWWSVTCQCGRPTRRQAQFGLGVIAALLLAVVILWRAFNWVHSHYAHEPDFIPWFQCESAERHRTESFDFHDFSSFTLEERLQNNVWWAGELGGKVKIVQASEFQDAAVRVTVDMRSTYLTYLQRIDFKPSLNRLVISSPEPPNSKLPINDDHPCTAVNIVVSVNRRLSNYFRINTPNLSGVEFSRTLSLSPRQLFVETARNCGIAKRPGNPKGFAPSHLHLTTVDGKIQGTFPLVKETRMVTVAGSIEVNVAIPRVSKPPTSAHFFAHTVPGNIHVSFPTNLEEYDYNNLRDYYVELSTVGGHIWGTVFLGLEANISAVSGDINAVLIPQLRTDNGSLLITDTVLGQTNLRLVDTIKPIPPDIKIPIQALESRHHSIAGGMKLQYPPSWEGRVYGTSSTVLGSVSVAGDGVEIIDENRDHVEAVKGDGSNELRVDTVSGSCEVLIGD